MDALLQRLRQTLAGEALRDAKDAYQKHDHGRQDDDYFPTQVLFHRKSKPPNMNIFAQRAYFVGSSCVVTETMEALVTSSFRLSGGTRKVTPSSFIAKMVPRKPPLVTTLSPVFKVSSIACHFF